MIWGTKITLQIYIEGPEPEVETIAAASEAAARAIEQQGRRVDFAGASSEHVQLRPSEQVAT